MNSHPELTGRRLLDLFGQLSAEMERRGEQAQLFVVGGAAMALAYDAARSTHDVDGAFEPSSAVRAASVVIAADRELPVDWLNDAVKGFLPGDDPSPQTVFESESLLVQVASPEYLLAMKLYSGRVENDRADAVKLFQIAGYSSADQAMKLLSDTYGDQLLTPRHQYLAQEVAEAAAVDQVDAGRPGKPPARVSGSLGASRTVRRHFDPS